MSTVPAEIAAAWGWTADELTPLTGGLINTTYAVHRAGAPIAVLQRLHPIFAAEVNLDIAAITAHLAGHGLVTPRLIPTRDGQAWQRHADHTWRALTWIDGVTVDRVPDPAWASAGGALVGSFHRAVADLCHDYAFARAGVHDTAAHLARLRDHLAAGTGDPDAIALGHELVIASLELPALPEVPRRHCHGDLKISNLLFDPTPRGVCLVDLDTLGLSTMAFELGDAMRSWCNPHGEDTGKITFDLAIFAAAIAGFRSVADDLLIDAERTAIVIGLETVCLELAIRFTVDAFRDDYFGWDPARFPSRRAHNLVRARGQLVLGAAVRAARDDAMAIVHGRF